MQKLLRFSRSISVRLQVAALFLSLVGIGFGVKSYFHVRDVFGSEASQPFITDVIVEKQMKVKKMNVKQLQLTALQLNLLGAFLVTLSVGAHAGLAIGVVPSVVALYNPLIGLLPIYTAYRLQVTAIS